MSFTGQSFSFDGTSLDTILKVIDWDVKSPPGDVRTIKVLGLDGAFPTQTTYGPYEMIVECLVTGATYSAARANRDTVMALLNTRAAGQLVFDEMSTRYYPAQFTAASPIDRRAPSGPFFLSLAFMVSDPFERALTPTVITLGPTSGTGSPETLNTPEIVGSADVHGVWILKNNISSGGSKTITLRNVTAKTTSTHTRSLNSGTGDWIRYTPASHKIEYSTDSGSTWNRAPEGWDGAMPFLRFGLANQLKLTSNDPITLEITYNAAYL